MRKGNFDSLVIDPKRSESERPQFASEADEQVIAWSSDGRLAALEQSLEGGGRNCLYLVDTKANQVDTETPDAVISCPSFRASFSADGRWLAYSERSDGKLQVYVRSVPDLGAPLRVSSDGGRAPRWADEPNQLYYLNDRQIILVRFEETKAGLEVAEDRVAVEIPFSPLSGSFGVLPGKDRFLVQRAEALVEQRRLQVVVGWDRELLQLAPAR